MNSATDRGETPAGWDEALAQGEADVAAGRVVPANVVRQNLRDRIARIEAKSTMHAQKVETSRR